MPSWREEARAVPLAQERSSRAVSRAPQTSRSTDRGADRGGHSHRLSGDSEAEQPHVWRQVLDLNQKNDALEQQLTAVQKAHDRIALILGALNERLRAQLDALSAAGLDNDERREQFRKLQEVLQLEADLTASSDPTTLIERERAKTAAAAIAAAKAAAEAPPKPPTPAPTTEAAAPLGRATLEPPTRSQCAQVDAATQTGGGASIDAAVARVRADTVESMRVLQAETHRVLREAGRKQREASDAVSLAEADAAAARSEARAAQTEARAAQTEARAAQNEARTAHEQLEDAQEQLEGAQEQLEGAQEQLEQVRAQLETHREQRRRDQRRQDVRELSAAEMGALERAMSSMGDLQRAMATSRSAPPPSEPSIQRHAAMGQRDVYRDAAIGGLPSARAWQPYWREEPGERVDPPRQTGAVTDLLDHIVYCRHPGYFGGGEGAPEAEASHGYDSPARAVTTCSVSSTTADHRPADHRPADDKPHKPWGRAIRATYGHLF